MPRQAVGHRIQKARDRQAAPGAAVGQHRRCGHEPQAADVIVQPLRMRGVVGVRRGDADEQVLIAFARQQIAIGQRILAEIGQQRIAAVIDLQRVGRADALGRVHRRGIAVRGRRVVHRFRRHRSIPIIMQVHRTAPSFLIRSNRRAYPDPIIWSGRCENKPCPRGAGVGSTGTPIIWGGEVETTSNWVRPRTQPQQIVAKRGGTQAGMRQAAQRFVAVSIHFVAGQRARRADLRGFAQTQGNGPGTEIYSSGSEAPSVAAASLVTSDLAQP